MRRDSIFLIWICGIVLAVLIYAIGPDRFFDTLFTLGDRIDAEVRALIDTLGMQANAAVHALTIALYFVFAVLAVLAAQRGQRGGGSLIIVTALVLLLVWRPYSDYPAPISRWIVALALVVVGALVMTQRLTSAAVNRNAPPPFPPGGRRP